MEELQNIGYRAFAYGFLADDIQTAYTTTCMKCTEPQVVDIMRSLVVVGKLQGCVCVCRCIRVVAISGVK